ncbi:MAG: DUF1501 domain-containing protein [Hyphomicrobiaceae bacterium]|nr:DUF1501 domain-containing protein [Hyphomicrobiaceae bacterium]
MTVRHLASLPQSTDAAADSAWIARVDIDGCAEHADITRRGLLTGFASLALWGMVPKSASARSREPRLLVVILRGGLDGLSLAAPVGDKDYQSLRGPLAIPVVGDGAGLPLDGLFALNAGMPFLHGLYLKREATIVHAVATPYRARSHFDGQDVLESGLPGVGRFDTGWLNRALAKLPSAGRTDPTAGGSPVIAAQNGLAMGAVVPLVMRGTAPVTSWTPKANGLSLDAGTADRLMDLYAATDPGLAKALAAGLDIDRLAMSATPVAPAPAPNAATVALPTVGTPPPTRPFRDFVETAEMAARFLTAPGGPRIGALSFDGWDSHANGAATTGALAQRFAGLDAALAAFATGMGSAWSETVVVLVTEFGRTARANGTSGTDHGTGTAALLLGGAVKGGRVLTDWPGLASAALHEGRDLKPTLDLRRVFKGVLRDHLAIPAGALGADIFPDSAALMPLDGLLA